jgi:ATP-binding cassette subfamily F protein 3
LLLAGALIQDPDVLLLYEPTNNLDDAGISHLTNFLVDYPKTVLVISHDANFLNAFTDGVIYLDVFTHKIETFTGNYFDVVEQIQARIDRQNRQNALMEKEIQAKKDQANVFAHKGGNLRAVAKKMREKADELEDMKVDVRREDKTIREFEIPLQQDIGGEIVTISSLTVIKHGEPREAAVDVTLRKRTKLRLVGPNGIGKTTLLEGLTKGTAPGVVLAPGVKVGYYRQDFSNLNFNHTAYEALREMCGPDMTEQELRSTAAGFLLT